MTDKERMSEIGSDGISASERRATGTRDWAMLSQTLVKSPQWTRNTLQGMKVPRPESEHESQEVSLQKELLDVRQALERRTEEMRAARQKLREQSAALRRRGTEIDRLQQAVLQLEFANAQQFEEHQAELEAKRTELSELRAAYEQFEHQSDHLLRELDRKNDRLRNVCKRQNKLSLL